MSAPTDLFPGFETSPASPASPEPLSRATYRTECENRWDGPALRDALGNWKHWQSLHASLEDAMRRFHRDPEQTDMAGKRHNPTGRLNDFLWTLQSARQPSKSCLAPLLDFEERHQKIFLRRGLVIYCTMLLREIERPTTE